MSEFPTRLVVRKYTEVPCTSCSPPCGKSVSADITFALPDGTPVPKLQPGDVYFYEHSPSGYPCAWSNCDGRHLYCIVPGAHGGHPWNIDGRASNCTLPNDKEHRCWIRHGDPSVPGSLHVDKNGRTCAAGAGSIQADSYHGHLHNGVLRSC